MTTPTPPTSGAPDPRPGLTWPSQLEFLRNRLIIAGLALLIVLLVVALVLLALGDGSGGAGSAAPSDEVTPVVSRGEVVFTGEGLIGRTVMTVSVHNGPGDGYAILGTIPRGTPVVVVGRNADASWLQVTYPPGSQLRGWVRASALEVEGDVSELDIAGPGAQPNVALPTVDVPVIDEDDGTVALPPTPTPAPPTPPSPTPAATATPTPPPTATPPLATETPPLTPPTTPSDDGGG